MKLKLALFCSNEHITLKRSTFNLKDIDTTSIIHALTTKLSLTGNKRESKCFHSHFYTTNSEVRYYIIVVKVLLQITIPKILYECGPFNDNVDKRHDYRRDEKFVNTEQQKTEKFKPNALKFVNVPRS